MKPETRNERGNLSVSMSRIEDDFQFDQNVFYVVIKNYGRDPTRHPVVIESNYPLIFAFQGKKLNRSPEKIVQTRMVEVSPEDIEKLVFHWKNIDGTEFFVSLVAIYGGVKSEELVFA